MLLARLAHYALVPSKSGPSDEVKDEEGRAAQPEEEVRATQQQQPCVEIMRVLFRIVAVRMVDGEQEAGGKSLSEKLQSIFDKLLRDYGGGTVGELQGCLAELFRRAAFHVASQVSTVAMKDSAIGTEHAEYLGEFKRGKLCSIAVRAGADKGEHEPASLQRRLHRHAETVLGSERRKLRLRSAIVQGEMNGA